MLCAGFMGLCFEGSFHLQAQSASALPWPRVSLRGVFQEVLGEGDQAGGSACCGAVRMEGTSGAGQLGRFGSTLRLSFFLPFPMRHL